MEEIFCKKCSKQLTSVDEIARGICDSCKTQIEEVMKNDIFFCEICKAQLFSMSEVAIGICSSCKASILKKTI